MWNNNESSSSLVSDDGEDLNSTGICTIEDEDSCECQVCEPLLEEEGSINPFGLNDDDEESSSGPCFDESEETSCDVDSETSLE